MTPPHRRTPRRPTRALAAASALIAALALAAAPHPAEAQTRDDGAPADTLGVGDNARASVWGPAALFLNPAGMSRVPAVLFQGGYGYLDGKDGHTFGVSAVDAQTNEYVAMGVGYTFISSAPDGRDRDGHQVRAGLSTRYLTRDVGVYAGVGLRYLGLALEGRDDIDAWTIDAGLVFDIAQRIRFGVTGHNMLDTETDEAPRELGLGLGFVFDALEVNADISLDLADRGGSTVTRYGFGAAYTIAGVFHVRTGLTVEELLGRERIAAGFGYSTERWAVDLGYETGLGDESDMLFVISLRYAPAIGPSPGAMRR